MKLSDKLIELRKEKGWSQEDFAEKLDVSRQAISRWENGSALPDAQNILRISKLFSVSADYLLNDDHEGERDIPASDVLTEETTPLVQKKKFPYWWLITAACFVILTVCIIYIVKISGEVHSKHLLSSVKENEIAPTCTAEGSYDEVVYCTDCNAEILRTHKITDKLAHTPSISVKENEVAPTCAAEGSYDEVVYCTDCNAEILRTHRISEMTAHTLSNSVKENVVAPTCAAEGSYDEVVYCTDCNAEILRTHRISEMTAHTLSNSVKENVVAATCTEVGSYDEVVYCTDCNAEILRTHRIINRIAHTPSSSVKENEVAPSCAAEGSYDDVIYCAKCKDVILRTETKIEKLDHQFKNRKCSVCGEDQPSEGLLYMSGGNGTCTVDIGDCTDENIVIPSYSPSGDKVVQIKAYAFRGRNDIVSVKIPETVTMIGEGAFLDCFNLESVNLPSKITMIYSYTFSGCGKLKEISIPSGVTYIGEEAFADCISLERITIPARVTKIGRFAFRNFSKCEGTVIFEVYEGWGLYDSSDTLVEIVDLKNSRFTPCEYISWAYSEYTWKRIY